MCDDKNTEVSDFLYQQIADKKDDLDKKKKRKEKIESELNDLANDIAELEKTISVLDNTLKTSLKNTGYEYDTYLKDMLKKTKTAKSDQQTKQKSIADVAYDYMTETELPSIHIKTLTQSLQQNNKITTQAKNPIASVTSALMRDKRFESLGDGSGRWRIIDDNNTENAHDINNDIKERKERLERLKRLKKELRQKALYR